MSFATATKQALTPEWKEIENKVVWSLRALLGALAVYALAVTPQFTTRPLLVTSALWGFVISLCFAYVPTRRPRTLRRAEACTLLSLALHVCGHAFGWYAAFPWYDTALHFSVPLVTVFILYALSQAASAWIWKWTRVTPVEAAIHLFAMAVTTGVLWEILEFGMDQLAGTKEQDSLYDTMIDLIADVLGAALGAVLAGIATKVGQTKGPDAVSEDPKRPYPARAPVGRDA